jgi:alpha-ribazole phosphatase
MIITITRHAQTDGNVKKQYVGSTDMPINQQGAQQAAQGIINPAVQRVYVTPLQRTQQTARIQYPAARQVVVPGLQEMNFGIFEGYTHAELEQTPAYQRWLLDGGMQPMQDGEGRAGFAVRVSTALQQLIHEAHQRHEQHLYIVSHGGAIMALMAAHALPEQTYDKWWVENLQGYRLHLDAASWHPGSKFTQVERVDLSLPAG